MSLKDQVLDTLSKLPNLSNKELYALYPNDDRGSIRNYKHQFFKAITEEENSENSITPITPGPKKKSKVCTKTEVKEGFQEGTLDRELIEMTDIELIRHTCRKIIATKINEPRIKLQASNILLSFVEKSGSIKEFMPDNEMNLQKKFKSMTTKDLIKIISNDGVDQHTKEEALSYSVSKEHMLKEERENING